MAIRNIPHAELQAKWLLDDSLKVQWKEKNDEFWRETDNPGWFVSFDYRLYREVETPNQYKIAFPHKNGGYVVSYDYYASVEEFCRLNFVEEAYIIPDLYISGQKKKDFDV